MKKDKHSVIRAGNITVGQGIKCGNCNLIRSYNTPNCICNKKLTK